MIYNYRYFFGNKMSSLSPFYDCGFESKKATGMVIGGDTMSGYTCKFGWPLPVVPVAKIIEYINEQFGVNINICKNIDFTRDGHTIEQDANLEYYVEDNETNTTTYNQRIKNALDNTSYSRVLDLGVVPCVKAQPTESQRKNNKKVANGLIHWKNGIYGCSLTSNTKNDMFTIISKSGSSAKFICPRSNFQCIEVSGYVYAYFKHTDIFTGIVADQLVYEKTTKVSMKFFQDQGTGTGVELASIQGVYYGNTSYDGYYSVLIAFDMNSNFGVGSAKLADLLYGNEHPQLVYNSGQENRGIYIKFDGATPLGFQKCSLEFVTYFNEGGRPHPMNACYSLPSIPCIDFIKSLFYMEGGFPKLNEDDSIGIVHYIDVIKNIERGAVYDWSNNIISSETPTLGCNTNYAQNNYIQSASDDEDLEYSISEKGYKNYKLNIKCPNKTLEETNVIEKIAFNAPYTQNPDYKALRTGGTFKYWNFQELYTYNPNTQIFAGKYVAEESSPSFGYLSYAELEETRDWFGLDSNYNEWNGKAQPGALVLTMKPWISLESNENYILLKKIIKMNTIVKEKMVISPLELYSINYAKPVYLKKYNSYFAIVNIEWHSDNGTSDVELIKIPR